MAKEAVAKVQPSKKGIMYYLKRDWQLYLMIMLPLACVIIFKYGAYPGLRMAFMNYKPAKGYDGSEWVGFETILKVMKDKDFHIALKNSLLFNFADLALTFPMPILLSLILNEIRYPKFKKVTQTILYLPHFLSWVIVGSVAYTLFKTDTGLVNNLMVNNGWIKSGIPYMTESGNWAIMYLLVNVWQTMGWGTIIYLAAITSINGELYEAAMIDGANRWQRMWHITLPGIKGTAVTLLIMNLGRVMGSSFERIIAMQNVNVRDYSYQLAVYLYEKGLSSGNFSRATVVGLFQSVVGLLLVLASDRVAKKLGEDGLI